MKRSAFTLIEFIFILIILGIIAAVALAKFSTISDRTRIVKLQAYAGSLNRTVGAAFWGKSMREGHHGSVTSYSDIIDQYVEIIPGYDEGPSLSGCNSDGNGTFLSYPYTTRLSIHCRDGNDTNSPSFKVYDVVNGAYLP